MIQMRDDGRELNLLEEPSKVLRRIFNTADPPAEVRLWSSRIQDPGSRIQSGNLTGFVSLAFNSNFKKQPSNFLWTVEVNLILMLVSRILHSPESLEVRG